MIREFEENDLERIMQIWLDTNLTAHKFISRDYWEDHFDMVLESLPGAEIYVYEINGNVLGFIGILDGYIAGLFVDARVQSKGIGHSLLTVAKNKYPVLTLHVYRKNERAIKFYKDEGFVVEERKQDPAVGEDEYKMLYGSCNVAVGG